MPNLPFYDVLINFRSKNPKLFTFATRFICLFFIFKCYFFLVHRELFSLHVFHKFLSLELIGFIHFMSSNILGIFGYSTTVEGILFKIDGTIGVRLAGGCIGFGIMSLFTGLILSYPGHRKIKYVYIPIGLLLILFMNAVRIALLAYLVQYSYTLWELNHKLIFKVFVYAFIFVLWVIWINKTSRIEQQLKGAP